MLMVMLFIPTKGLLKGTPYYALSTIPLIHRLPNDVTQVWYADDASACGEVSHLRLWWDQLSLLGPHFGYFPNVSKTWFVVKEQYLKHAQLLFVNTCINVTTDGRPHLGAAIGFTAFVTQYISNIITTWIRELKLLPSPSPMLLTLPLRMD